MNQRVNIQYSVKIQELEGEVGRLITKTFKELDSLADAYKIENILSLQTAETVELLRQKLADIDYMLQDTHNIVIGYLNYKTQSQTLSDDPAEPLVPSSLVSELEEKINKFKETTEANSAHEVSD